MLGIDGPAKTRIRRTMLRLYRLRSKYVHGAINDLAGYIEKNLSSVEATELWLRNAVRVSLLAFLGLADDYGTGKKRESMLTELDSVFDPDVTQCIRIRASELLALARPYEFPELGKG